MVSVKEFPSPYGVLFILILKPYTIIGEYGTVFPSPYGVLFILMLKLIIAKLYILQVSVSLWSIIHSYATGCISLV